MFYGERLKEIRESNKILQESLAKKIGIEKSAYSQYENEYQIIPIKHLNTLCNYFNISIDYVLGLSNIMKYNNFSSEINTKLSGKRLKDLRKENKITQNKLASILNSGRTTIASYETGKYIIATPFLYTICSKYHISADYLLGKIDKPKYLK